MSYFDVRQRFSNVTQGSHGRWLEFAGTAGVVLLDNKRSIGFLLQRLLHFGCHFSSQSSRGIGQDIEKEKSQDRAQIQTEDRGTVVGGKKRVKKHRKGRPTAKEVCTRWHPISLTSSHGTDSSMGP
jgi:hypothetical protein